MINIPSHELTELNKEKIKQYSHIMFNKIETKDYFIYEYKKKLYYFKESSNKRFRGKVYEIKSNSKFKRGKKIGSYKYKDSNLHIKWL